jgi:hypothetical protein
MVTIEGTDGDTMAGVRDALEEAGAQVLSTLTITSKLELAAAEEREELRSILGAGDRDLNELRRLTGRFLGGRAAIAAAATDPLGLEPGTENRFGQLVERLADAGYLSVDGSQDVLVTRGAHFVAVAGSTELPPFDPQGLMTALTTELSERGSEVVAAEPLDSAWGVVQAICDDGDASSRVSTVDQANAVPGRIAIVLALDNPGLPGAGHYGVDSCADEVIPDPDQVG